MKKLIIIAFLIVCFQLNAQRNIDGLINAEKSFAAYSVEHGTKNAFLSFADSNGIVFDQSKSANAIEVWNKRENQVSILNWKPQFAEIASSNNFGYTTGPWTFQRTINDRVIARGQYVTVWHISSDGEWKFVVDLGVGNTPKVERVNLNKIKAGKISGDPITSEVLKAEQNFINVYKTDIFKAYTTYLSRNSILTRNGMLAPATSKKSQLEMIVHTPKEIQFTITGSGIAASGDMAFVYGNCLINNKPENFLHIWRKEKGGWKIALEVLRY